MDTVILTLKQKADKTLIENQESWDGFELLAVACSYCCTQRVGGNETCPPKPAV